MTESLFNGLFAAMMSRAFIVGIADADKTLEPSVYKDNEAFLVQCGARASASATVPQALKVSVWQADPGNTQTVTLKRGSGTVTLEPGQRITLVTDGSQNGIAGSELTGSVGTSAWLAIDSTDTPFQASAGHHLDIDTTTGAVTVTLPAGPALFDEVWFSNEKGTFAAHALTIARNGETIMGLAENMTVSTDYAAFSLRFNGTTWRLN